MKFEIKKLPNDQGAILVADSFEVEVRVPPHKRNEPQFQNLFHHEGMTDFLQVISLMMKTDGEPILFEILGKQVAKVMDVWERVMTKEVKDSLRKEGNVKGGKDE